MEKYLVTTNLQQGILKDKIEIVHLGIWSAENNKNSNVMPYLWNSGEKNLNAAQKCDEYYEYCLEILTKELNVIHKKTHSNQYYRIVLGNWLLHYIQVNYDRFMSIYLFHKKYGDFNTALSEYKEYFVPNDFFDFTSQVKDDPYNFQIYSNVIHFLFPIKNFESISSSKIMHIERPKPKTLKIFLQGTFSNINRILNHLQMKTILIANPYFGENGSLKIAKLVLKSRFEILYNDMSEIYTFKKEPQKNLRKKIHVSTTNRFKQYLANTILKDIPMIYLEDFNKYKGFVERQAPLNTPSIIYTSIGMQGNDAVKFYVAEHMNSDMKVITNQHGASYGTSVFHMVEGYERSVSDYFFTSGWQEDNKTIPFGIPKLCKNKTLNTTPTKITYLTTYHPKYLVRFDIYANSGYYHTVFFERMEQFFSSCSRSIVNSLQIKSYPNKDCYSRINEIVEKLDLNVDVIYNRKLSKIFEESKLIIMDHMGTSMLEAFAINKPIVLILDPNIEIFRDNAQPFMDALERVGIVHFSIVGAVSHIDKIEEDVRQWWDTKEVQQAVDDFRNHYAKCDEDWIEKLIKQFDEIGNMK